MKTKISATLGTAIAQVLQLPAYCALSKVEALFLFREFRDAQEDDYGLYPTLDIIKEMEPRKFCAFLGFEKTWRFANSSTYTHYEALQVDIMPSGLRFIAAVKARLETLRYLKQGCDLFPDQPTML